MTCGDAIRARACVGASINIAAVENLTGLDREPDIAEQAGAFAEFAG